MNPLDLLSSVLVGLGCCFFFVGALGLVRFPDALSRLNAVSKAASAGLGFTVLGLLLRADSVFTALKLLFIWGIMLVACATSGQLVGRSAVREERRGR
ncbi:monovalent cation/H(+) antiporter subunit G [Archangium violaceum]|uniref:cation:proton antiporter n=1 Tax=Archangium violaceum TaxID=83451 RepID=UPI00194DB8A0|nr:monovalent cation/H(+) antiporter subunit G [Archangium violaceum]QRN98791.1 monovalent cation/H(+) antiporter subunit G [Archangium violaceum]